MPRSPFFRPAVNPTRGNPLGSPFNKPKRSTEPAPTTKPTRKRTPRASADDRRDCPEAQPAIDRAKTRKPRTGKATK